MRVLGIETSCDETGVAIYDSERGLLGHALHSQVALHAEHGGVVPELASRDHVRKLVPLLHTLDFTQLVQVGAPGHYRLLGESVDDAAGEAFDKTAKLLGLGYPGGPALARLAERGDPQRFRFPRPMTNRPGLDFSFSGLKTFALNTFLAHRDEPGIEAHIARAFQDAVIDTLIIKCRRALKETALSRLVVAGGVSANRVLRSRLR